MSRTFTLGATERLKSRKALEAVFSEGKGFMLFPYRVLFRPVSEGLSFTVGVSARNFKKATDRNRLKRQTREAYRLQKNELKTVLQEKKQGLQLFLNYTSKSKEEYQLIHTSIGKIMDKLIRLVHEDRLANP